MTTPKNSAITVRFGIFLNHNETTVRFGINLNHNETVIRAVSTGRR